MGDSEDIVSVGVRLLLSFFLSLGKIAIFCAVISLTIHTA